MIDMEEGRICIEYDRYNNVVIYGDAGWDCAIFTDKGLKVFIRWLKTNKPDVFE